MRYARPLLAGRIEMRIGKGGLAEITAVRFRQRIRRESFV
jgi:hypothetical protein